MRNKIVNKINKFHNFVVKHKIYFFLTLLFLPSVWDLLQPGYFSMHDDLQVFRLLGFHKCLLDGQLPCVWIPDGGFGYGYPMFGFYPPLPYFLSEAFHLLGINLFWSIKIMFILALILSGFFMYKLSKVFFGKIGGIISSVFYVYAPYHALDIYVRGAGNEAWGMVWFPLILLYSYQLIQKPLKRKMVLLSLSYAALLLSHNVMTLIFTPFLGIWCLFWMIGLKRFSSFKNLIISGLWGMGLSGFFFLPVILEKNSVHIESMTIGYFNYLAHFADAKQMFLSRFWGYGGSTWGPKDDMAQPIGHFHWVVALIVLFLTSYKSIRSFFFRNNRQDPSHGRILVLPTLIILTVFIGFSYAFLAHSRSVWFWDHLPLLYYAQFPWRLLTMVTFLFSFVVGYLGFFSKGFWAKVLVSVLILGVIFWNIPFFHSEKHPTLTIGEKFSGSLWELQTTGGIFDYLPQTASRPPGDGSFYLPQFIQGNGGILNYQKGSNWLKFTVKSDSDVQIMAPIFVYPGMKIKDNGKYIDFNYDSDLGRALIDLSKGDHEIFIKIYPTAPRLFGMLISFISLVYLIKFALYERKSSSRT